MSDDADEFIERMIAMSNIVTLTRPQTRNPKAENIESTAASALSEQAIEAACIRGMKRQIGEAMADLELAIANVAMIEHYLPAQSRPAYATEVERLRLLLGFARATIRRL
jgi:hypothetical protein